MEREILTNMYVANVGLLYVCVGNYTLPLDHSVLVRSDICHLGYHGDTCSMCGLRADQAIPRVPVGLSDWPPKCGAVRLA